MKERKNLDRLFQEKFKDFEADPDEQVWKNIEAALRGKKKRRIVPIWFRFAGVAALFLLGLFTFNQFFNGDAQTIDKPSKETPITSVSNGASGEGISPAKTLQSQDPSIKTGNGIAHGDNKGLVETSAPLSVPGKSGSVAKIEEKSAKSRQSNKTDRGSGDIEVVSSEPNKENNNKHQAIRDKRMKTPTAVAGVKKKNPAIHTESTGQTDAIAIAKHTKSSHKRKAKTNTTGNPTDNAVLAEHSAKTKKDKNILKEKEAQKATAVALQEQNKAHDNPGTTTQTPLGSNEVIKDTPLKSSDIALSETKKDSLKKPNELEELLKKSQEKEEKTAVAKADKWQVTTNIAPVYFSSASGGSPIDQQFAGNNKTYETNMSYGVGVNYAVSKRISIRAGVNKFTVGYNTKDVLFYAGLESQNLGNITPSGTGSFIQVVNQSTAGSDLLPFEVAIKDNNNVGYINQQMGYIEVPMEMSYKILDSKFSVSVIGGLSTLFLDENAVSIHSGALTAKMGEANNLNDVHFSSNFGLGLRYRFIKSLELHCEPTFKYQINTFSNDAGNFKPYLIGIYSGLSFSF